MQKGALPGTMDDGERVEMEMRERESQGILHCQCDLMINDTVFCKTVTTVYDDIFASI